MGDSYLKLFPRTVDGAVDKLLAELSFADRVRLAAMSEPKLALFFKSFGPHVQMAFRLPGNDPLMQACADAMGQADISGRQAAYVIVRHLWQRLKKITVLKVVK